MKKIFTFNTNNVSISIFQGECRCETIYIGKIETNCDGKFYISYDYMEMVHKICNSVRKFGKVRSIRDIDDFDSVIIGNKIQVEVKDKQLIDIDDMSLLEIQYFDDSFFDSEFEKLKNELING